MAKKNIGSRWRFSAAVAVLTPFFSKLVKIYAKRRLFSFLTYVPRLKPSLITTDYMKVAKLPSPLKIFLFSLKRLHFSVIHSQFCCYAAGNCTFSHSTALKGVEEKNYLLRWMSIYISIEWSKNGKKCRVLLVGGRQRELRFRLCFVNYLMVN